MQNVNTQPFSAKLEEQLVLFFGTRNPAGVKQTILLLLKQYQKTQPTGKHSATDPVMIDCTALLLLLGAAEQEVANWEIDYQSHTLN